MFVIGFTSIALGNYINSILNSTYLGHGIISLFYLIVFIALYRLSKSGILKNDRKRNEKRIKKLNFV